MYQQFQKEPFLIAKLVQGKLYELGVSEGECYGFTHAMADPDISPYQVNNYSQSIDLTQKTYDYQKNQHNRKKDQKTIQRTRLTREYFCPDYSKQDEKRYYIWKTKR